METLLVVKVKDLVKELLDLDQEAVVLYAYDGDGSTGVHGYIESDLFVKVDDEGVVLKYDEENNSWGEPVEVDNLEDLEADDEPEKFVPAIKLFAL